MRCFTAVVLTLSLAGSGGAAPAFAATAPATGLRLAVSPPSGGGTFTVTSVDPCPPPAASTQPQAVVGSNELVNDAVVPGPSVTVPVAADGSWSATLSLSGAGHHTIDAFCRASPQAEGAYAAYDSADAAVVTRSVGYWVAGAQVSTADAFGDAIETGTIHFATPVFPIVGVAAFAPTGLGYWTVATDGGVFSFGDASFHGSMGGVRLAAPVTAMAATDDGGGYWLLGRDGGVFTFGDAPFYGAGVGDDPGSPAVGIAATGRHTQPGYLIAHADGAVFLHTAGSPSRVAAPIVGLAAPVVGITGTPSQAGWYLGAADGGVFTFGDARFAGSAVGIGLNAPITGITARTDGGYWLVGADNGILSFGGAPFLGTFEGSAHAGFGPAVGITATPDPLATPQ